MSTIFTKIINREIPASIIAEDNQHLAFLDINPLKKGHTLVIPKVEVDYIFDLTPTQLSDLHLFSQKVARGLQQVFTCNRIGLVVMGLEVPHAHIHLIPMDKESDLNFSNPKLSLSKETRDTIAKEVAAVMA